MKSTQSDAALVEWRDSARYWRKHAATIRAMFAPVTAALINEAAIKHGSKVLDVAGGPGEPSLSIAQVVGAEGLVVCTDAIAQMVEAARDEAVRRGINNVTFRQCVADSLTFDDSTFDAVVSRLGAMFFPNIDGALREMLRVAKRAGRVSLVVWGKSELNPFSFLVTDVVSRFVPTPPPTAYTPDAFRYSAPGALAQILTDAGAVSVRERNLKFEIVAPISFTEFWSMRAETSGSLREKLATLSPEDRNRVADEVKTATKKYFPDNQMRFPAEMLIITGERA